MSMLDATTRIAYQRRASPLHAAAGPAAALYGIAIAIAALVLANPILLATLLVAVLCASLGAGVAASLLRSARAMLAPIVLLTVLVNVLVDRGGLTVFARLGDWGVLGQVNLTVEAAVYGAVFGLRLLVVALACLLVVCAANPDELMRALRRVSPRSALTAALGTRMLGVLGGDARRLAEAQRCRPDGGAQGVRGKAAVLRATVAGALERSLDVAAVLEMRGYGTRRAAPAELRRSRHDRAFALAGAAMLAIALIAQLGGGARFSAQPLVSIEAAPITFVLAALLLAVALLPFADRRGIER